MEDKGYLSIFVQMHFSGDSQPLVIMMFSSLYREGMCTWEILWPVFRKKIGGQRTLPASAFPQVL